MPDKPETSDTAFIREDDFTALYANNFQFEASAWDLKMLFGQLDQRDGGSAVEQHTAMTMSWPAAKMAAYYLLINVIVHQTRNGLIQLPLAVIPNRPDPSDPVLDEPGKKLVEYLAWVYDQFFSDHPYVPTGLTENAEPLKPNK